MNSQSFELLLNWADNAVYEMETCIPKFFKQANTIDENGGYRDAFGMYFEEQASYQVQSMSEAVGSIPTEKWDAFLKTEGGWPSNNQTFENRRTMRRLTAKFLKENLGFCMDLIPASDDERRKFWVNNQIEEFIAEETEAMDDRKLASDLALALREAFHKTSMNYIVKVSYCAYNRGDMRG